jgi:hypothetical protein
MTHLAGSLLFEFLSNGIRMVLFLFQRGTYRRQIQRLLLQPHAVLQPQPVARSSGGRLPVARTALLASCVLLSLMGCCSPSIYRPGGAQPGTQFSKEIDELVDSTITIFRMPGWKDSLTSDLEWVVDDDPCALRETFELWGW